MATNKTNTTQGSDIACQVLKQIAELVDAQAAIANRLIEDCSVDDINDAVAIKALAKQAGWMCEHAMKALGETSMEFGAAAWLLDDRPSAQKVSHG